MTTGPQGEGAPGRPAAPERDPDALRSELEALRLPRDPEEELALEQAPPSRSRWGRRLTVLLLVGIAGAAAWALRPRPVPVEVVRAVALSEVAAEPLPVLSGSGYLVPARPVVSVGARISGRIDRYLVDEGDPVEEGQPLVRLDDRPFRAAVRQLEASLASARARERLAAAELARGEELARQGVLSADALDRRAAEAEVARASVAEIEAALARARIDLDDTVVRAPIPGVVLETNKQPGEVAVPGGFAGSGDLLRLADLRELRAELEVGESDLALVHLGQQARITPDAHPGQSYAGRVVELAPAIDRQKGTRRVEVRVLDADDRLLPDMSVRVVFLAEPEAGGQADGVLLPRRAIARDSDGRPVVRVVRDDRAETIPVELGESLGERIVVRGSVAGGEPVVVGAADLADSARVRVRRELPPE